MGARTKTATAKAPSGAAQPSEIDDLDTADETENLQPVHGLSAHADAEVHPVVHPVEKPFVAEQHYLDAPPPRPGMVQRWVRIAHRNDMDQTNYGRRLRAGWQARSVDTIPADHFPPTIGHGRQADGLVVEGNLLCEMPEERYAARQAEKQGLADRQMGAIDDNIMRIQSRVKGTVPVLRDIRSRVTVGRRPVTAAPD